MKEKLREKRLERMFTLLAVMVIGSGILLMVGVEILVVFMFVLIGCVLIVYSKMQSESDLLENPLYCYDPLYMLDKVFTYNDRTYKILKYIGLQDNQSKFECICLTNGTKEYWYEQELILGIAKEDIKVEDEW